MNSTSVGRDEDEQRGPREVRADAAHDVVDVGRAAADEHRHAGRWRQRGTVSPEVGDERPSLRAVRAIRCIQRKRRQVVLRRRGERLLDEPVARTLRVSVQQLVLLQGQPRVDVDEAGHAADALIRRDPSRVVVELGEVGGARRRAIRPDRERERRELAFAELAAQEIERGPGRDIGRQDRRVRGVEADVEERGAEQEQQRERRDQHGDRAAHHRAGEGRPAPVRGRPDRHPTDRELVDPGADDRQQGGHEGQRRRDRKTHDDRAGDPDRAQDHELEQDEPEQAEQHRQAGEEHRPPRRRDRRPDRIRDVLLPAAARGQLLAEAARHEQRVVDAEPQSQQRGEIEHEHAHRHERRDHEDRGERDEHRRPADREGDAGRHERAEHQEQGDRRERQRDHLASTQVLFRDALDIAVECRSAGQRHLQPGCRAEPFLEDRDGVRASRRAAGRAARRRMRCGRRPTPGVVRPGATGRRRRGERRGCRAWPAPRRARRPACPLRACRCGRPRRGPTAAARAPSSRRAFARADSRSSRMNPPADRTLGARGANGSAASRTRAHAPTTHHLRRTTNRPSRSKRVTPSAYPRVADRAGAIC